MKLSVAFLLSALVSTVFAVDAVAPEIPGVPNSPKSGHYVDLGNERRPFKFEINFKVPQKPIAQTDVMDLVNGEKISLEYTFTNNEDEEVNVAGVGGSFRDPATFEPLVNLTDAAIGPISIGPRETKAFTQHVSIDLIPTNYLFTPSLYIVYQNGLMMLGARSQLTSVTDPSISFFNPQLLILEVILLGTFGFLAYFLYTTYGAKYLSGTVPIAKKTSSKSKGKLSTGNGKSSGFDESWLPDVHVARTTRSKKTKRTL